MLLNTKHLIGLPVVTRSEQKVGKVASFDVDILTGKLAVLYVKASGLVARLSEDELLVSWDAILEITAERVVIVDAAIQSQVPTATVASAMTPSPSGTFMKEV
jgi:sporulation protein YlmC with PRC-barrel domain